MINISSDQLITMHATLINAKVETTMALPVNTTQLLHDLAMAKHQSVGETVHDIMVEWLELKLDAEREEA
jgi:hypothetical protein